MEKCNNCNKQGHIEKANSIVKPYPKYFLSSIMRYKFDGVESSRTSIEIDLDDVLHHQTSKLLTPEVKQKMKMLKEQGATFVLYFKYGNNK